MKVYTATPSEKKGKFELQPDGTLGHTPVLVQPSIPYRPDNLAPVRTFHMPIPAYDVQFTGEDIAHIDWFRATATGSDILFAVDAFSDLLTHDDDGLIDTDFVFNHSDKGLLGYPKSVRIAILTDGGLQNCGTISYQDDPLSSNCGVMLDLSGQFFAYLKSACPAKVFNIYEFCAGYGFRVSRLDNALDLSGEYCRLNNITVPNLMNEGKHRGLFNSEYSRNGTPLSPSVAGDWSIFVAGSDNVISIQEYDPAVHASKGLTVNFGSRKQPNFFRVYEKTKQLISLAELGDDHDLDKWAVRIEHEIKRDKDGSPIPLEILLAPDAFFGLGRPDLRALFDRYALFLTAPAPALVHKERFQKNAVVSLKAKIFWGKRAYGRLVRTLHNSGMSNDEIFDELVRDVGLKDFVYDLVGADNLSLVGGV